MNENIRNITEKFDFEKVHAYMTINKWTYRGEKETPSIKELKNTALSILYECEDEAYKDLNKCHKVSTGGFMALYTPWERQLELYFYIEKDHSYYRL